VFTTFWRTPVFFLNVHWLQVDGVAPPLGLLLTPRHACRPWVLAFQSLPDRNVGLAVRLGRVICRRRRVIRIHLGRAVALFYFVFITLFFIALFFFAIFFFQFLEKDAGHLEHPCVRGSGGFLARSRFSSTKRPMKSQR
jgi:hypothetical protein